MIRPLSLFVLLGASAMVFAQPLYKWVEPDGAITFSVTKPPAGVTFEVVNPDDSSTTAKTPASAVSPNSIKPANQNAATGSTKPSLNAALPPSTTTNQPVERIAPRVGAQAPENGITRSGITRSAVTGNTVSSNAPKQVQTSNQTAQAAATTRKQRQCEDLQKRVVSLERRLRTRLTPEDMDNTVVHMARYQRSYDQHCAQ